MSFSGVFSKFASLEEFLSVRYFLYFCASVVIMVGYAVIWQQVLKKIPLSIALLNRPVVLILTVIWAVILFHDKLSLKFFVGFIFILSGIFLVNIQGTERKLENKENVESL